MNCHPIVLLLNPTPNFPTPILASLHEAKIIREKYAQTRFTARYTTIKTMKTLKSLLTATVAVLALSSTAFAQPPGKSGSELSTKAQFAALKAGDKVTLTCKMDDFHKEITIKNSKGAMELCEQDTKVHCGVCKKDYKVTQTNPTGKTGGPETTITIVDDTGKPCMVYTKAS